MRESKIDLLIELIGNRQVQIKGFKRTARKDWKCSLCGASIPAGSLYYNRVIGVTYSHEPILSEHFCLDCEPEPILKRILARQRTVRSRA
jgi:ribosomal protein L37AE/L43A